MLLVYETGAHFDNPLLCVVFVEQVEQLDFGFGLNAVSRLALDHLDRVQLLIIPLLAAHHLAKRALPQQIIDIIHILVCSQLIVYLHYQVEVFVIKPIVLNAFIGVGQIPPRDFVFIEVEIWVALLQRVYVKQA